MARATLLLFSMGTLGALGLFGCSSGDQVDQTPKERTHDAVTAGSCFGYCDGNSPDGCGCDSQCSQHGDCCSDYAALCHFLTPQSCDGVCGGQSPDGSCWCDDRCSENGDCCSDYASLCSNDACASATVIPSAPYVREQRTTWATTESSDPRLSCSNSSAPQQDENSVWYTFTPKESGTAVIDVSGASYGVDLAVHTGTCGNFTEVACQFLPSGDKSLHFEAQANQTYYIEVTDWYGDGGGGGTLPFRLDFFHYTFKALPQGAPGIYKIAVDPNDENIWYAGTTDGVYVTNDGGNSWNHYLAGTTSWGIAFDPTRQGVAYVGSNNSLWIAANGGTSFYPIEYFPDDLTVYSVLVSQSGEIYVGHYWGGKPDAPGLYKASDPTSSFEFHPFDIPPLPENQDKGLIVWDIAQDRQNGYLYVGTETAGKPQNSPYHPPTLRSKDGGITWDNIYDSLPHHSTSIQVGDDHKVYFQIEGGAVYTSVDFGDTAQMQGQSAAWDLLLDPRYAARMYASSISSATIRMSNDDGVTFHDIGPSDPDSGGLLHLAFNKAGTKLYAGLDSSSRQPGVYVVDVESSF